MKFSSRVKWHMTHKKPQPLTPYILNYSNLSKLVDEVRVKAGPAKRVAVSYNNERSRWFALKTHVCWFVSLAPYHNTGITVVTCTASKTCCTAHLPFNYLGGVSLHINLFYKFSYNFKFNLKLYFKSNLQLQSSL